MSAKRLIAAHTALLVESIEDSVDHLTKTLSLEFKAPAQIPFEVTSADGSKHDQVVRACYTQDMTFELLEAGDAGPISRSLGMGMHHHGGPVADIEAAVADQREAGNEVDWELRYEGQLIGAFFRGCPALPGRLEFVSAQAPPLFDMYAE